MSDEPIIDTLRFYTPPVYRCPVHGDVSEVIASTLTGYEGAWCQRCWLVSLGPPIPRVEAK